MNLRNVLPASHIKRIISSDSIQEDFGSTRIWCCKKCAMKFNETAESVFKWSDEQKEKANAVKVAKKLVRGFVLYVFGSVRAVLGRFDTFKITDFAGARQHVPTLSCFVVSMLWTESQICILSPSYRTHLSYMQDNLRHLKKQTGPYLAHNYPIGELPALCTPRMYRALHDHASRSYTVGPPQFTAGGCKDILGETLRTHGMFQCNLYIKSRRLRRQE
jgi:hypothetical protein